MSEYLRTVWMGFWSTLQGMRVTMRHFLKEKRVTVQYPYEPAPVKDGYRGIHYLEQEKCIGCFKCANACPVDCITIEYKRHGKVLEWQNFTIDYNKCLFCDLCVDPCPVDCIWMGREFNLVTTDRKDLHYQLLTYTGLTRKDRAKIAAAEEAKKKAAAAKAVKAAQAKAAAAKAAAEKTEDQAGDTESK